MTVPDFVGENVPGKGALDLAGPRRPDRCREPDQTHSQYQGADRICT